MSCYVRHLQDILEVAGLENNKENRKRLDMVIRQILNLDGLNCPDVWKEVKERRKTQEFRQAVILALSEI
ncbi:MAG TPA: hypothetical protein PLU88_03020 [Armatimonadota bacterium]|jgi:hypothetical protein|nr:hypothetical protein [Armatimonadota bacterium]HOM73133.1 hypothetical protein [Armatimonadota bacterium]HPP74084.1 hypothetical protein [Armatimonadota bacterium]